MSEVTDTPGEEQPQEQPVNPTPQPQTPPQPQPAATQPVIEQPQQRANLGLGVAGIIISVFGGALGLIPCAGIFLGGPLALIGIIMGAIYWYQASKYRSSAALGIVALSVGLLAFLAIPGKWVVLSIMGENAADTAIQNLPASNTNSSAYSYGVDSTEVDEELEEVVDDIVEDEEEEVDY